MASITGCSKWTKYKVAGTYEYLVRLLTCQDVTRCHNLTKGLGNELPIGVCLARNRAAELFSPGHHASTFGGNPLACRSDCTILDIIEYDHIPKRAAALGHRLLSDLHKELTNISVSLLSVATE